MLFKTIILRKEAVRLHLRYRVLHLILLLIALPLINITPAIAAGPAETQASMVQLQDQISSNASSLERVNKDYLKFSKELEEYKVSIHKIQADERLAKAFVNKRIVYYYKSTPSSFLSALLDSNDIRNLLRRAIWLSNIFEQDAITLEKIQKDISILKKEEIILAKIKAEKIRQLAELKSKQAALQNQLNIKTAQLVKMNQTLLSSKTSSRYKIAALSNLAQVINRGYTARGTLRGGFVFPVNGPHDFTDSWGSSRSGGRRHKGTDIMAMHGTPIVACVSGYIERLSRADHGLGGICIYLRGVDGNQYYYAHLDGIASNMSKGSLVSAGQLIGFVGSTGNASANAPHLHFEIHRKGETVIDPYITLKQAEER